MTPTPPPTDTNDLAPDSGPSPEQDPILQALKTHVQQLCENDVRLSIDPEKIWQYATLRRNELYWRGNQYLDEVYNDTGQLVDYKPIQGTWHEFGDQQGGEDMYATVVNDVRGYGRKFIAVLAQSPPNVKMEPNDDQNDDHIRRARKAQRVADLLHNLWDVKKQNRKLFLTYYKDGTAFGKTTFVSDAEKYGMEEQPVMTPTPTQVAPQRCVNCGMSVPPPAQPACPQCGAPLDQPEMATLPQQTGVQQYPRGCVEHQVESGMRVTTNFDVEDLDDCPFLFTEQEIHKGKIFAAFPWLKEKFKTDGGGGSAGGGTASTSGQITRDIASSPSGSYIAPRKNRLLFSQFWLRPIMYSLAPETNVSIDGQTMPLKDALAKNFPHGLKVTQVDKDHIVKLEDESMDDVWCMSPPEPAENAYPDALMNDFVDTQDETNDYRNIQRQTLERAIPQLLFDTSRVDMTFQARYRQLPASLIPVKGNSGGALHDVFSPVPVAKVEPEMDGLATKNREHSAEIIGITPQIYGGGAAEQTAYATNLKRNQAMLQLSMYADAARSYWCEVTYNAVLLEAKYSGGIIPSPHAPRQETVKIEDIEELLQGGFHAEAGDAMPMSWPEQREQLNENLKNLAGNPDILHMLGFMEPKNIPKLQDTLLGMPEWAVPNQAAFGKVNRSIQELLKSQPTQQPGQMDPNQMVDIPSIPVDEWDDHGFFAQAVAEWMDSEKGADQRQSNPPGFANVVAFWKSHKGLSMPPPMPGGPPPPGGAPPGGPPPGPGGPNAGPPPPQGGPGHLQPPPGGQQAQGAQ